MFIFTAKVDRRKLTAAAVAGVVLCGALVALFVLLGGKGTAVSALADPKGVRQPMRTGSPIWSSSAGRWTRSPPQWRSS